MDNGIATPNEDGVLTGRIAMNNAGVLFKVVEHAEGSARDVESWEKGSKKGEYTVLPRKKALMNGEGPLMTAQLTLFSDGGCVLGVIFNHLIADGWSVAMFMRDWSEVHNGRAIQSVDYHPPKEILRIFSSDEMK